MSSLASFEHQFVKSTPRQLSPGILYVSLEYCTMLHLCACGCGRKVVTPLSPNDWSMTFNGKSITISPSIGSWSLPCRSHYFIKHGQVVWADQWSDKQIRENRQADLMRKRECPAGDTGRPYGPPLERKSEDVQSSWIERFIHRIRKGFL